MTRRVNLAALAAAGFALLSWGPVAARPAADTNIATSTARVVSELCPAALSGKLDMNDASALAAFGLAPSSAEREGYMRRKHPDVEMADATLTDGGLVVGVYEGNCLILLQGPNRMAALDATIATVAARGGKLVNDQMLNGTHFTEYNFLGYSFVAQRDGAAEVVAVSMTRMDKK